MTKDDLIRMADRVGYDVDDDDDVHAPASGRYGLDPRLEHFAQLVSGYTLRYECPDMSKKTQNVDTSEKCVHETDKLIHEIEQLKDLNQRLVTVAKELGAADDTHEWDDAWSKMCKLFKEVG
jgi:hypothetical protein